MGFKDFFKRLGDIGRDIGRDIANRLRFNKREKLAEGGEATVKVGQPDTLQDRVRVVPEEEKDPFYYEYLLKLKIDENILRHPYLRETVGNHFVGIILDKGMEICTNRSSTEWIDKPGEAQVIEVLQRTGILTDEEFENKVQRLYPEKTTGECDNESCNHLREGYRGIEIDVATGTLKMQRVNFFDRHIVNTIDEFSCDGDGNLSKKTTTRSCSIDKSSDVHQEETVVVDAKGVELSVCGEVYPMSTIMPKRVERTRLGVDETKVKYEYDCNDIKDGHNTKIGYSFARTEENGNVVRYQAVDLDADSRVLSEGYYDSPASEKRIIRELYYHVGELRKEIADAVLEM